MSPRKEFTLNALNVHLAESRARNGQVCGCGYRARDPHLSRKTIPCAHGLCRSAQSERNARRATREKDIDWSHVTALHMDEYLGLPAYAPQRFGLWLRRAIFDHLPFAAVHLLEPGDNPALAASDYAAKLRASPIDIVCCGIGSNGHLAFNDPPADFEDPLTVKIVDLDLQCRQQQVDEGCFAALGDVPTRALTITLHGLLAGRALFCTVPGALKKEAVRRTLLGPVDPMCPASALRLHPRYALYLDADSASEVPLA